MNARTDSLQALLGLALGGIDGDAGNRLAVEGLTLKPAANGAAAIDIRKLEASSLRLASGPLVLEVARLALHDIELLVDLHAGRPRLHSLQAADAELHDVKAHGPLDLPPPSRPAHAAVPAQGAGAWCLGPLAAAEGTLRAQIVDAHLLFDADVTVPVRQGQIQFNDATVAHVGPDSRMGVSRLGLYVDAPNGRSYLYQFASAPVAGVEFERRGALLGPWITHRGSLRLQEFGEGLLRQGAAAAGQGFTAQARLLLQRTALSGELRLGDGRFCVPGVQAELVGRAEGRNAIRLQSQAVGRGLTAELASLAMRDALLNAGDMQAQFAAITGSVVMQLTVEGAQVRFSLQVAGLKMSGLRVGRRGVDAAPG
jgi:hypothetical protein